MFKVIQFTGLIASLSCASYAISKFFSGIITSPANSKFLFISSLAISGIAVILSTGLYGFNEIRKYLLNGIR